MPTQDHSITRRSGSTLYAQLPQNKRAFHAALRKLLNDNRKTLGAHGYILFNQSAPTFDERLSEGDAIHAASMGITLGDVALPVPSDAQREQFRREFKRYY